MVNCHLFLHTVLANPGKTVWSKYKKTADILPCHQCFPAKWCFNNDYRNSMLYIWHMPLHFNLGHAIKLLQPINQNQSITSLFVTYHKYLLQPIKSTAQIWVVNISSMEFLHFLKSYLEGKPVEASWNVASFLRL